MSTPAYASINFMAWEYWTDGYADADLAPTGDGLRRCLCGCAFLLGSVEHVRTIRSPKPLAPKGWDRRRDNAVTRFFGRCSRDKIREHYDTRTIEEIEAEQSSIPPHTQYFANSELKKLIESGVTDVRIMGIARRLYWRYLNEPCREVYRNFRKVHREQVDAAGDSATFPEYRPTPEQVLNMQQLIGLLKASEEPRWLEIAELHRELGDMEAAQQALNLIKGDPERLQTVVQKLVNLQVQGPVRFYY
jgi:hypothetical protein